MTTLNAGKRHTSRDARLGLRILTAILLGGLLVVVGAQSASSHAELVRTTPEDGAVMEQAPADAVLRSSADGHSISGSISFTAGDATSTHVIDLQTPKDTQFAVSILTGLQYVALLVFAGLNLFDRAVLRNLRAADPRSAFVLRWTGIVAAVASMLLVPASALNVTGDSLTALFTPSVWWGGVLWAPAAAAAIVLVGAVGAFLLATRDVERRYVRLLAVALALLALAAPILVGHTRFMEPRALIAVSDFGHLLAGSFWAGGVVGLILFLASARAVGDKEATTGSTLAATVVQRFSRLAIWSVVVLAISGTIMGLTTVGRIDALFTTEYGRTLLLKVGIIIPILAIASYNRFQLLPRLSAHPTSHMWWRLLARTLGYEAALLVLVLVVTGFLTNLSPAHEPHNDAIEDTAAAETATIGADARGLTIAGAPALTGGNDLRFPFRYEDELNPSSQFPSPCAESVTVSPGEHSAPDPKSRCTPLPGRDLAEGR